MAGRVWQNKEVFIMAARKQRKEKEQGEIQHPRTHSQSSTSSN
jgi:hypothetical protein